MRCKLFAYTLSLSFIITAGNAYADGPRYDDIMPISQVHAGMHGYGLTVFRGTKIEKFDVTVVDVLRKGNPNYPGHDAILIRMAGGPITIHKANLIQGMSGSPIYINGKVIGAFSMGEGFTKEPLGYATPIEEMLDAWDPKLPTSPLSFEPDKRTRTVNLAHPIQIADRRITRIIENVQLKSGLRSHGQTLVLHPCTTFAAFCGTSRSARETLAKALEPYNVELVSGLVASGKAPSFKGAPLVPGAAFNMMLNDGDFPFGANGTISYRKGNRVLGFGHPFLNIGPIDAPLTSAYIYDIQPLLSFSHKIFGPGPVVGSSNQDRNFAISGVIGKLAKTIPISMEVKDLTTGRSRSFHSRSVSHPNLYSAMVSAAVQNAVAEVRNNPGPTMIRVTTSIDCEEVGKVTRTNVAFDERNIDSAASADLDDILGILRSNPFYPVVIKSASVKVELESGHRTAQVERVFLKEGKFEPGQTAEVGVVIKPYKSSAVIKTIRVAIPPNTPSGRYVLQVKGGAAPPGVQFGGFILRSPTQQNPDQAPPVSIRQMVNRYNEREKNNDLVVKILFPTTAVNVEGEKLNNLPPSLDALMRTAKSSSVRLERDEVKVVEPTEWIVSGQQLLAINVQKKDIRESALSGAGSSPGTFSPATITTMSSGPTLIRDYGKDTEDDNALASFSAELEAQKKKDDDQKKPGAQKNKENPATPIGAPATAPATEVKPITPAIVVPDGSANDKPVGRSTVTWRQTSRADFASGTAHGVSVNTHGDLQLARSLKRLQSSTEGFLWCLIPDGKGGLFAGTGTQGKVLHIDSAGNLAVFARVPELSVHALLLSSDGSLWAGTSPNGRTYHITAAGKAEMVHEAKSKYALALAKDSKGNVYVGTGGGGEIYKISTDGKSSLFFKAAQQHVLCLAIDSTDNLYAGTSTDGLVYRIGPDGHGTVLYDAAEQSITALAINSRGSVYAATAPRGMIYRVESDGSAKNIYDNKNAGAFSALCAAPDDTVYAAAGSSVYAIKRDDTVASLENRLDVDILSLAVGNDGTLFAGSGNVAEVYSAAPSSSVKTGAYESVVHDAKQRSQWGTIRWTGNAPAGTRVRIETRSGNVSDPDSTWSDWTAPKPSSDGGRVASPLARFIQYRVTLETDKESASPAVRDVAITYLPRNQAPKVAFTAPAGGERWSKQQTIRWEATDPDKDTLSYELFYSADNGSHWLPLPVAAATAIKSAEVGVVASGDTSKPAIVRHKPPTVSDIVSELDRHPDLPAALRDQIVKQTRDLNESFTASTTGETPAQPVPVGQPAALRETNKALDTKALADGTYILKVIASDRPSNAVESISAEAVSEAFTVCNAPPIIYLFKDQMKSGVEGVTLSGSAIQNMIAVSAVQFRVDGGDWQAAVPMDGIFDGLLENFNISTGPLSKGTHTIEVKAFNAANGQTSDKVAVEIK